MKKETLISNNIKALREQNKLNQREFSEVIGVSASVVSTWENAGNKPRLSTLKKMAKLFNISLDDLTDKDLRLNEEPLKIIDNTEISFDNEVNKVPLIGTIAAGFPIYAEQYIEDYIDVDKSVRADFCLKVKGDSMIGGGIFNDDIVFIKSQNTANNGDIVAVQIQKENQFEPEATLKKIAIEGDKVILSPMNPDIFVFVYDIKDVKILGKLVATLHFYR